MHFASCPPYTFTMLRSQWKSLKPELKPLFKEQSLCRSLGGVPIPLLTIGNEEYTNKDIEYVLDDSKKIILIVGRAHPGEAPSSFVIQGMVNYLLSDCQVAENLRSKFIFKIVPMLNVDGVIIGNSRTDYTGKDLNEQYRDEDDSLYSCIASLKQLIQHLKEEYGENFSHFLDIHSTQQRKNYFMHGPQYDKDNFRYYIARFFPKLLSKHTQYFRYKSCTFKELSKNKNTSFQFVKNTFRVFNSYSVEASAGFYRNQEGEIAELGVADWEAMGRELLDALLDYTETMDIYEKLTENKRRQQEEE